MRSAITFFWMFGVPPPITNGGHESMIFCQRPLSTAWGDFLARTPKDPSIWVSVLGDGWPGQEAPEPG